MSQKKSKSIDHVAIIMDGNGRWAQARAHKRIWGHIRGARVVNSIVEAAEDCGVKALTLYAFSTENFSRPMDEVQTLFKLLKKFIIHERKRILKNNLQFRVIGDTSSLPKETIELISSLEKDSSKNTGLILSFAFGYGGRTEIVSAINKYIKKNPGVAISEDDLSEGMFCPEAGDVDLMIRTGGDQRISNFLLWQVAYGELFFIDKKWPDFTKEDFYQIYGQVSGRERRFGSVQADKDYESAKEMAEKNVKILTRE